MRKKVFRVLLALLAVSAAVGPGRSRAIPPPNCFEDYQVCVNCGGPDLQKKCTHYTCDDGTEQFPCGQCSIFCTVN